MQNRKLPTSQLSRMAKLATLGLRTGAGQLVAMAEGAPVDQKIADAAAEALGTMRGLALKLGQLASYVDGVVPENAREAYEKGLQSLRNAAPTMSPEGAARVLEAEFGEPASNLFAEFEFNPFASASIGQVHRARLHDGREVAVKIQFEDVDKAVLSDLKNASFFKAFLGPIGARVNASGHLEELTARFKEELDYRHEATRQREFASIFQGHDSVHIPEVIASRSGRRVLTTEFVRGIDFEAACAGSIADRKRWAETLWRFVFGSILRDGLFNADPHPGNYVFKDDGAVSFLDFGCTRKMSPDYHKAARRAHEAAIARDPAGVVDAFVGQLGIRDRSSEYFCRTDAYLRLCFQPITQGKPYRFTREYTTKLFDDMKASTVDVVRGKVDGFLPLPAEMLFFNRLQLGFYSILARLDVEVDYGQVDRECLELTSSTNA